MSEYKHIDYPYESEGQTTTKVVKRECENCRESRLHLVSNDRSKLWCTGCDRMWELRGPNDSRIG